MKLLVTGREGQVARSLAERAEGRDGIEIVFVARPDLDLAEPDSVRQMVRRIKPDVIVSAAAYTSVDKAEDEEELAMRVNGDAPGILAEEAVRVGGRIIQISTDYVFDGSGEGARRESDEVAPLGVYGRSKLAGEEAVRRAAPDHLIMRTAWVYSPFGGNFVKTMLRLAGERDRLSVVDDQHGNPTSALDIADAILTILEHWKTGDRMGLGQTFHLAGTGEATWCGFARHVLAESARLGGPCAEVSGISTADYPTRAIRPANSRLDSGRFAEVFGYRTPDWRQSSTHVVERLLAKN